MLASPVFPMNIRRVLPCVLAALCLCALFTACSRQDERDFAAARRLLPQGRAVGHFRSPDELAGDQIRTRIEVAGVCAELSACGEPVYASAELPGFYIRRLYRPAWEDSRGPTRQVDDLVNALHRANLEGLRGEDYHLAAIETLLVAVRADGRSGGLIYPDRWAELDLLLTDAFLMYGSHLLAGRVNPETIQPEWVANRRGADLAAVLETALRSGDVAGALAKLAPPQRGFRQLREALAYHRAVAARGGWPTIPVGQALKRGDRGPAVAALRERLRLGGDLGAAVSRDPDLFDEDLEQAMVRPALLDQRGAHGIWHRNRRQQIVQRHALLFMQQLDSTLRFGRNRLGLYSTSEAGGAPTAFIPLAHNIARKYAGIVKGINRVLATETVTGIPTTAHILGGAVMGENPKEGVIDAQNKVFGYENMYICDGSAVSANPGVNPSLTITAIAERAMSKIPAK